jgi:type I restriction enzyme, S subunit
MITDDHLELPEGWIVSSLGTVAFLVKDKVDPTQVPEVPYLGLEHVEAHTMKILGHGWGSDVKSTKTKFSSGDVLYGKLRPYLNKVARPDFDGICSTDFLVFTESPDLDCGFLGNYLNQLWVVDRAHHLSNGVELPRVDWKSLAQLPIGYPKHKADQRAIVALVEGARGSQANARTHFVAARQTVDRFRQAVLAAACSGRMTADWREAHANETAEELMDELTRLRRELLGPKAKPPTAIAEGDLPCLPSTWRWVSVDALARKVVDGVHKTPNYVDFGIPFITVRNLTAGDGISFEETKFVTKEAHREYTKRAKPEPGDILISKDGTIGVTRCVRTEKAFSIFVSVAMVKPLMYAMSDYLELALSSPAVQRQMVGVGSGLKHLVLRDLKADGIPLPPLEEQAEIVACVSELLASGARLLARLDAAIRRTDRSSHAILAQAFRGDLLPSELNGQGEESDRKSLGRPAGE